MIAKDDIRPLNMRFQNTSAESIIAFALRNAVKPMVTTSFGAHSAAVLYAATRIKKDIKVVWCDTGYNTNATHRHAQLLIKRLQLNIEIFKPKPKATIVNSTALLNQMNTINSEAFARNVKLEPFERAMNKYQPDVWFTTIRKNQTTYRDTLDIFSFTKDGVLRVSPFYHYNDEQIVAYLRENSLPMEYDYFDPLKVTQKQECGIQLRS